MQTKEKNQSAKEIESKILVDSLFAFPKFATTISPDTMSATMQTINVKQITTAEKAFGNGATDVSLSGSVSIRERVT
jgi:hypothetical protein